MRTYIVFLFGLFSIVALIEFFELCGVKEWPRKRTDEGLGQHVASLLIHTAFALWAAFLLWIIPSLK